MDGSFQTFANSALPSVYWLASLCWRQNSPNFPILKFYLQHGDVQQRMKTIKANVKNKGKEIAELEMGQERQNIDYHTISQHRIKYEENKQKVNWIYDILHGCVKSTVIQRRQHQLGRMADFPPPVTFSVFDL